MKTIPFISLLFVFSIFSSTPFSVLAIHSPGTQHELSHDAVQLKNVKKKSILNRWLEKRVTNVLRKISEPGDISKQARTAQAVGLGSFFLLLISIVLLSSESLALLTIVWILAAITAIIGDIISIRTLNKIKNSPDKNQYAREKKKAIWGLVFSLATGLIPLLLLLLVLI